MVNYNNCKLCNKKIEGISYSNKVYCSGKCRHYAYMVRCKGLPLDEAKRRCESVTTLIKEEDGEYIGKEGVT